MIKENEVNKNSKLCYIIAEMSANHAGSKENAKEIIHAAKESGANCIKLQTYNPDTMTINCNNKYFQISSGTWSNKNLYQLYKEAYTPWQWQAELKEEADKIGIDFLSTPFDKTSVDFLEEIGVEKYKIASFEIVDLPLIEYVASKGKPILISTGMATSDEIQDAVDIGKKAGAKSLSLLKCSSSYPAVTNDMNLRTIIDMKNRFNLPVGLSDHTLGSLSAVTAVALGADILEKHFCINRSIKTPDSSFSMEPAEFKAMVKDIRDTEKAIGNVYYGATEHEKDNIIFRRSIFVVKDIKKGEGFTEENIRIIRPGYGLKPKYYSSIIGKKATQDIVAGTPLSEKHFLF